MRTSTENTRVSRLRCCFNRKERLRQRNVKRCGGEKETHLSVLYPLTAVGFTQWEWPLLSSPYVIISHVLQTHALMSVRVCGCQPWATQWKMRWTLWKCVEIQQLSPPFSVLFFLNDVWMVFEPAHTSLYHLFVSMHQPDWNILSLWLK